MATPLFDLVGRVIVTGVDQFNSSMNSVEGSAVSFASRLSKLSKEATAAGMALTKGLTLPIMAVGGAVIKMGADFEQAMDHSLSIVQGVTAEQRKQFEQVALSVSKNTTFSAKEAAGAFYYLASAGLDAATQMKVLSVVAKYAEAGNIDLKTAAENLTDVLGALGLNAKDATQYYDNMTRASDVLTKASSVADGTIGQFTEALMNGAGAALRVVNKSMEEGVAVLAAFSIQGIKGAAAGKALYIVLRDLQTANIKHSAAWKDAGISVYDASGKMKNMATIIKSLEDRLSGMSDKEKRQQLLMLGFQDRSVRYIMQLLGMSDAIKNYQTSLEDATGFTEQTAAAATAGFWAQLKMLGNQFAAIGIVLYQTLSPALKNLVGIFSAVAQVLAFAANAFNALPGPVKQLAMFAIALVAAIGPMYLLVGGLAKLFVFLAPLVAQVVSVFATFISVMVANPIIAVAMAVGLLVYAGYNLIRAYGSVGAAWSAIWEGLKNITNAACRNLIDAVAKTMVATLKEFKLLAKIPGLGFLGKIMDDAIGGVEKLKKKFDGFFGETATKSKAFANTVSGSFQKVNNAASKGGTGVGTNKKDVAENKQNLDTIKQDRAKFEADWEQKAFEATSSRHQILVRERQQAIAEAKKLGASVLEVNKYYDAQERALVKERLLELVSTTQTCVNNVMSAWADYSQARIAQLDNREQEETKAIQRMSISEEEKSYKIMQIEEKYDKKKKELQRKEAIREKALAIFNAVINGAVAFVKALTMGPIIGWIMAGMIAASTAAQVALIAAKPIPFARGGLVKGGQGGIHALMGEEQQDELVLPMHSGISALVDALISEVNKRPMPRMANMTMNNDAISSFSGGIRYSGTKYENASKYGATPATPTSNIHHWNVGVLVADDRGLKELERRQAKFRISENQRRGHLA
jgi:TP901 family phage tail tape measure protein